MKLSQSPRATDRGLFVGLKRKQEQINLRGTKDSSEHFQYISGAMTNRITSIAFHIVFK